MCACLSVYGDWSCPPQWLKPLPSAPVRDIPLTVVSIRIQNQPYRNCTRHLQNVSYLTIIITPWRAVARWLTMGPKTGEVEGDLGLTSSDFQLDFMISWLVLTTCLPLKTSQLPSIDLWHEDTELEVHRRYQGVDPSVGSGNRAQRGTAQPLVFQIDAKSQLWGFISMYLWAWFPNQIHQGQWLLQDKDGRR